MLRSMRSIAILASLVALPVSSPFGCFGQGFIANLTRLVTDPGNAVVPIANLKLVNTDIREERQTTTSGEGRYTFSQLLPGNYELTVTAARLRTSVQHNIVLITNQSAAVNFAMNVDLEDGGLTFRGTEAMLKINRTAMALYTESGNESGIARLPAPEIEMQSAGDETIDKLENFLKCIKSKQTPNARNS